jgi:DNA-binding response OmpR family regulator
LGREGRRGKFAQGTYLFAPASHVSVIAVIRRRFVAKGRHSMKKTILIADEDASVREALGRVLEEEGYGIILAADSQQAIERFESGPVDLVLLDIELPIRDGWDTFERITSHALALPIIVVTGKGNHYDMVMASGIGALMEKPLDVSQLLQTMQELMAETNEARLHRLCGDGHDTRYFSSQPADG